MRWRFAKRSVGSETGMNHSQSAQRDDCAIVAEVRTVQRPQQLETIPDADRGF